MMVYGNFQMKRPNKVRDKIFAAAHLMRKQGIVPTTINIRGQLGGSQSTASKYLRQWRELYDCEEDFSPKMLQKQLVEQGKINANLTNELLITNTQNAQQSQEIKTLQTQLLELSTRLAERERAAADKVNSLNAVNQTTAELFNNATQILSSQLTAINAQAISKVQEVGQHFDEQVMNLKLELRALKEQLAAKDKELKNLNEQLVGLTLKSQVMTKEEQC